MMTFPPLVGAGSLFFRVQQQTGALVVYVGRMRWLGKCCWNGRRLPAELLGKDSWKSTTDPTWLGASLFTVSRAQVRLSCPCYAPHWAIRAFACQLDTFCLHLSHSSWEKVALLSCICCGNSAISFYLWARLCATLKQTPLKQGCVQLQMEIQCANHSLPLSA